VPTLVIFGVLLFLYVTSKKRTPGGIVHAANKLINLVLAIMAMIVFGFIALAVLGIGKGA
jgi:hypothetical protein